MLNREHAQDAHMADQAERIRGMIPRNHGGLGYSPIKPHKAEADYRTSRTPMPIAVNRWGEVEAWCWSAVPVELRPAGLRFVSDVTLVLS